MTRPSGTQETPRERKDLKLNSNGKPNNWATNLSPSNPRLHNESLQTAGVPWKPAGCRRTVGPRPAGSQCRNRLQPPPPEEPLSAPFPTAGSAEIPLGFLSPYRFAARGRGLRHGGAGEGGAALRGLRHRYQDRHPGDHARGVRTGTGRGGCVRAVAGELRFAE